MRPMLRSQRSWLRRPPRVLFFAVVCEGPGRTGLGVNGSKPARPLLQSQPTALWLRKIMAMFLAAGPALCGEPGEYVGAQTCKLCHPAQFARQSASGHARALNRATEHPLAASFLSQRGWQRTRNYAFEFTRTPEGFIVEAFDYEKRRTLALPIEWAFGAGNHAITFASRVTRDVYIEHSFSYYPDSRSFDLTPGHRFVQPESLALAMGVLHKVVDPRGGMKRCFGCHSTGPVNVTSDSEIQPSELGVRCEVCHGPGGAHQKAVLAGDLTGAKRLIRNPKRMTAGQLNQFCGTCHRFPGENFVVNWNAVWNVRHQPPYLQQSRCFQNSGGALSCLTCHDPHERLRQKDAAYYAAKCLACHSPRARPPASICREQQPSDCVACHMPQVRVTQHLQFVNHWIGVYHGKDPLKPVKR